MKKILLVLVLLQSYLFAHPYVSSELNEAVTMLYRFPESRQMLDDVEKEGQISIYSAPFPGGSEAKWVPSQRSIVINTSKQLTLGEKVRLILFELHNAYNSKQFDRLDQLAYVQQISKRDYILQVERLEHQNALHTKTLIDKAIALRLFPGDSQWQVPSTFKEHMDMQAYYGHSAQIGNIYDSISRG